MPSSSNRADRSFMLVQLSDSHLFEAPDGRLLGMDTCDSLQQVVARVREEQPDVDLLLATGDISQDGSFTSYERFLDMTECVARSSRWFAGNHDDLPAMRGVSDGRRLLEPVIELGNWRVVLLDSSIPGAVPGLLAPEQLRLLESSLSGAPDKHHLIGFHHHPVPIGCSWLEPIGLRNRDELFAVLDRYPNVRALLWGHVHQEYDQLRKGVRLLASPSTCVQFAPGSEEFQVGAESPGYRWLRLHPDGRLDTGVSRVTGIDFEIDYSIRGY